MTARLARVTPEEGDESEANAVDKDLAVKKNSAFKLIADLVIVAILNIVPADHRFSSCLAGLLSILIRHRAVHPHASVQSAVVLHSDINQLLYHLYRV